MSLFPAYDELCGATQSAASTAAPATVTAAATVSTGTWLENRSYSPVRVQISSEESNESTAASNSRSSSEDEVQTISNGCSTVPAIIKNLEFDGNEDFYVDKQPAKSYQRLVTLHRPVRPRYRVRLRYLYQPNSGIYACKSDSKRNKKEKRRYYRLRFEKDAHAHDAANALTEMERNKILARTTVLNGKVIDEPDILENWLELYELQTHNPYKFNKLSLAQRQLHLLKTALTHHKNNEQLTKLYVDVANRCYPSTEVSSMLDSLLLNDAYNYTLWTGQIMSTQGTMARCNVPDVLQIYERCMRRMHHGNRRHVESNAVDTDPVMLKLFYNCALFLRQAGNYEQCFALLKLALELNVASVQFENFNAQPSAEKLLLEYEELVLQSGLPMHEIWLRVEKLRQAFNFLPYTQNATHVSDPQRCVFNADICHYIYPLRSLDYLLQLLLIVVQLTKLPFVTSHSLSEQLCARIEQIGDLDDIELVLAPVGQRLSYALPARMEREFMLTLHDLAKEMVVNPSFLSHGIGHELYVTCLSELLLKCAEIYASSVDETKRRIFILLWFRFERMRLVLEQLAGKLKEDYVRAGRARIKLLLKQPAQRQVIAYYTELALYEYEALTPGDSTDNAFKIFESVIQTHMAAQLDAVHVDVSYACMRYAELLMANDAHERAKQLLSGLALGKQSTCCSQASMLAAVERYQRRLKCLLDGVLSAEKTQHLPLTRHFLPDEFLVLLKARCLLQFLLGQYKQVYAYLDELLATKFTAKAKNQRCAFYREQIFEIYITLLQLPGGGGGGTVGSTLSLSAYKVSEALSEFPRNLHFLQRLSMLTSLPWYQTRSKLFNAKAGILSIIYLIAAIRCRYLQMLTKDADTTTHSAVAKVDRLSAEMIVRNRILNIFRRLTFVDDERRTTSRDRELYESLKRNSLFWRFYLRCLSDERTDFDATKECLLTALDECPWNKALYLDGATYVPQEAPHMQDLMMEKLFRMYALPEELQILRQ